MSDNQALKVIKPCPYCGGRANMEVEGTAKKLCTIACQSCGAKLVTYEEGEAVALLTGVPKDREVKFTFRVVEGS